MATIEPNGKITLKMNSSSGEAVSEVLGYVKVDVNNTDTSVVAIIDTFARNVNRLTSNTYIDTIISYDYSLNDIIS